jgi:hypothetical protein
MQKCQPIRSARPYYGMTENEGYEDVGPILWSSTVVKPRAENESVHGAALIQACRTGRRCEAYRKALRRHVSLRSVSRDSIPY